MGPPTTNEQTAAEPAEAPSGLLDGRYRLMQQLGRGSTGTVWEACDERSAALCAIKILHPELAASTLAKKRFLRECASARALSHPHTVAILGHGETAEGRAYLVMERLAGSTLAGLLRREGSLPQARAVRIISQILEAVEAAHRLQIVHRDLKPSNIILIERDGDPDYVKVCDFGLAKAIEPEETCAPSDGAVVLDSPTIGTGTGEICGTPEYMSPEQARGEPLDARSDLYAVGVMLFYALVGQLPFRARSSLAVVSLHLTAAPPRPSVLRPDLEIFPPLEQLILRALAKDRAERPSSAGVLRADLLQLQRDATRRGDARAAGSLPMTSEPGDTLPFTPATWQAAGTLRGKRRELRVGLGLLLAASAIAWLGRHALLDSRPRASNVVRSGSAHATLAETRPVALAVQAASTPERPLDVSATGIDATTLPEATLASAPAAASARAARRSSAAGVSSPPGQESSTPATGSSALRTADELLARGLVADACAAAQSAANRQPAYAPAWKFLGQCYMRLGDRARANASYRRYLELTPNGPDAIFVREMLQDSGP